MFGENCWGANSGPSQNQQDKRTPRHNLSRILSHYVMLRKQYKCSDVYLARILHNTTPSYKEYYVNLCYFFHTNKCLYFGLCFNCHIATHNAYYILWLIYLLSVLACPSVTLFGNRVSLRVVGEHCNNVLNCDRIRQIEQVFFVRVR